MKLLTNKHQELYENAKICHICKKKFEDKYITDKKYCKVRDHCYYKVNTELLHIAFSDPVEKEVTKIYKNGQEIAKTISCRLQLIDSARFMASPLSNLVDNLSEGIHKIKCTNSNKCCLEYTSFKDGIIEFKCYVSIKITKKSLVKT